MTTRRDDENPAADDVEPTDSADELSEEDSDLGLNYTERHPEHFRNPPGHVRELRDGEEAEKPDETP